jgi:hypothetical protein
VKKLLLTYGSNCSPLAAQPLALEEEAEPVVVETDTTKTPATSRDYKADDSV